MTQARDLADGKFDTNTLVVDAANNRVGIGTAAPDVASHIVGTDGKTTLASHDAQTAAVVENNSDAQFAIIANSSNSSQLFFGDESSELVGRIRYDHSADAMRFYTNSSERLRILSGGGITFNGDTATANALDDYEEGSNLSATVRNASGTVLSAGTDYDIETNKYTKIGQMVFVAIRLRDKRASKGDLEIDSFFTLNDGDRQYGVHFGGNDADSQVRNSTLASTTRIKMRGSGEFKYGFYSVFT